MLAMNVCSPALSPTLRSRHQAIGQEPRILEKIQGKQFGFSGITCHQARLEPTLVQALCRLPNSIVDACQSLVTRQRVVWKDEIKIHRQTWLSRTNRLIAGHTWMA